MKRTVPTWRIPEGPQPVSCWLLPPNAWVDCSGPRHTRFDMTLNGELHLGHISTILLNEQVAHRSSGTFQLRFDDLPESSPGTTAEERQRYAGQTRAQLEWLGIPVDVVTWHSEHQEQVHEWMASRTAESPWVRELFAPSEQTTNWPGCMRVENPFPFLPHSTAATAIQDAAEGRNCLIRGDEMLSQYQLYVLCCRLFRLPVPEHWYIPAVRAQGQRISKTMGNCRLSTYQRSGWGAAEIRDKMAVASLVNPRLGWRLDNLRTDPEI